MALPHEFFENPQGVGALLGFGDQEGQCLRSGHHILEDFDELSEIFVESGFGVVACGLPVSRLLHYISFMDEEGLIKLVRRIDHPSLLMRKCIIILVWWGVAVDG